jgi:hypothetical protein
VTSRALLEEKANKLTGWDPKARTPEEIENRKRAHRTARKKVDWPRFS